MPQLRYKVASEPGEIEQIHRLNYRAFVEEIPQHPSNDERRLVDRFNDENVYLIALSDETVVGMLTVRGMRPFSLDGKLTALDSYLPPGRRLCELRLLAIEKEHRTAGVLPGLLSLLWEYAQEKGFDCGVISATTRQLKLYRRLGFEAFGPLVGTAEAPFQPMFITREVLQARAESVSALPAVLRREPLNFLPGPASLHADVAAALQSPPEWHRSAAFVGEMQTLREGLRGLTQAPFVDVLLGSGTLANDAIAAQLARLDGRGVILSNGEFGERLADHARRARLDFECIRFDWGRALDFESLNGRDPSWMWVVACETSTGVLNDVERLTAVCRDRGARLALDCVSAIGAMQLDLSGVYLASGASGKALAGPPGLSMVFHDHAIEPSPDDVPRYLDLGLYARNGVPFTHSSNLVRALAVALRRVDWPARFDEIAERGAAARSRLRALGFEVIGAGAIPAPHVITIALPPTVRSVDVGCELARLGFLIAYGGDYLSTRNWIQIAMMGEVAMGALPPLARALRRAVPPPGIAGVPPAADSR